MALKRFTHRKQLDLLTQDGFKSITGAMALHFKNEVTFIKLSLEIKNHSKSDDISKHSSKIICDNDISW